MSDGSRKTVATLVEGDKILGVDGGGKVVTSEVTRVFKNGHAEKWLKIKGKRRGVGRGNHEFVLRCTPEHNIWHATDRSFIKAGELKVGDPVLMLRSELSLTPLQFQVLLGKLLGDGSLASNGTSAHVSWGHRAVDADYTRWVSRALGDLDSESERPVTSGYGTAMLQRRSVNSVFIQEAFADFTCDGVKRVPDWVSTQLTPIALAFWYMDDGSLTHAEGQEDRASFATCGFTERDCAVLVRALSRLGIEATISDNTDGYPRVVLGADAAEAMFLLVAPYIPKAMQRKLPKRYQGHEGWLPASDSTYKPFLVEQTISDITEDTEISSMRYDIETTTHNYFANGILVHNSNFRVHFPAGMTDLGDVTYGSREVEYDPTSEVKFPLPHAVTWFKTRPELLMRMWETIKSYGFPDATVFGEAFGPGVDVKGVRYSEGQEMLFRAFDIMVGENFVTYDLFCEIADRMEIPRAPEVWRGDPTKENFDALLNKTSGVALDGGIDDPANLAEGVVIRSNPLLRNVFGEWLIIKHKRAKFSEVAHAPAVKKERGTSPADDFAATYVTEGRLQNALGRLKDRGVALTGTMKDMPTIIVEIIADLHKEAEADWPEGVADKQMQGCVSRVLGPILRGHLGVL